MKDSWILYNNYFFIFIRTLTVSGVFQYRSKIKTTAGWNLAGPLVGPILRDSDDNLKLDGGNLGN